MQKFEFPLERLLQVRRQQERLAEIEQLRSVAALDAARGRVRDLRAECERMSTNLLAAVGQTIAPHRWAADRAEVARLGDAVAAAEAAASAAAEALRVAARKRSVVAAEVEAIETLRREQMDNFRREFAKVEQDQVDEAGRRRWAAALTESE